MDSNMNFVNRPLSPLPTICAVLLALAVKTPAADLNSTNAWPFVHPRDSFQSSALLDL
jgi:hypothetical protein